MLATTPNCKAVSRGVWGLGVLLLLALGGCATTRVVTRVEAYARPGAPKATRYVMVPGNGETTPDNLTFQEYAFLFEQALAGAGFERVADTERAELMVYLSYATSEPQTQTYSYVRPIMGQTGVRQEVQTETDPRTGATTETTTRTPIYDVVEYRTEYAERIVYEHVFTLEAYEALPYLESGAMLKAWKVNTASIGPSSDLRFVMPFMVASSRRYFGASTGHVVTQEISSNDAFVKQLRAQLAPQIE